MNIFFMANVQKKSKQAARKRKTILFLPLILTNKATINLSLCLMSNLNIYCDSEIWVLFISLLS